MNVHQQHILVILGVSRSGKDTLCRIALEENPGVNIKFSGPMKRTYEYLYDLPEGSLDDYHTRFLEVPNLPGVTYLDIMIRAFETWPQVDPYLCIRKTRKAIDSALSQDLSVVFTDIRNPAEVETLKDVINNTDVPLKVIRLNRETAKGKASDKHLEESYRQLKPLAITAGTLDNNGTVAELRAKYQAFLGIPELTKLV